GGQRDPALRPPFAARPYPGPGQVAPPSLERKKRVFSSTTPITLGLDGAIATVTAVPLNPVGCQETPASTERYRPFVVPTRSTEPSAAAALPASWAPGAVAACQVCPPSPLVPRPFPDRPRSLVA